VGGGTDATRVASYDPWVAIHWLTTGRSLGGMALYGDDNLLGREEALAIWTTGSAWFSGEQDVKGRLEPGMYADLAVLSVDLLSVPDDRIRSITSVLTVVGGKIVFADAEFGPLSPPMPPVSPGWSVNATFASPAMRPTPQGSAPMAMQACADGCGTACGLHGHAHQIAWSAPLPVSDRSAFWGALGCSCFMA
jgi:hypothetical protein